MHFFSTRHDTIRETTPPHTHTRANLGLGVYGGGAVGGDDLAPFGLLGGLAGLLGQLALVGLGVERTEVVVLPGQLPLLFVVVVVFFFFLLFLFLTVFLFISFVIVLGLYVTVDLVIVLMMLALVDNVNIFIIVFLKEDCGKLGIVIIGFEWGLPLVDVIVDAVGRWRRARG
jgi:hypothetical protein